ncbi:MAG TPA: hypothetical protein PLV68_15890, partial [Ilumatobacteraceae bacterium]|nr:hypothetical protein [Ilumatobacteraceae bacterium]
MRAGLDQVCVSKAALTFFPTFRKEFTIDREDVDRIVVRDVIIIFGSSTEYKIVLTNGSTYRWHFRA